MLYIQDLIKAPEESVCVSPFLSKFVTLILGYFCFTLLMLQKHTDISTICMGGLAGGWKWGLWTGRHTLFMTEPLNMLYLHRFKCQHTHDSLGHSRLVREWNGGGSRSDGAHMCVCVCCDTWGGIFFPDEHTHCFSAWSLLGELVDTHSYPAAKNSVNACGVCTRTHTHTNSQPHLLPPWRLHQITQFAKKQPDPTGA